ncbi:MAG: tetratricopeptide repeat protein [Candidatus Omnitrophota bacterium]
MSFASIKKLIRNVSAGRVDLIAATVITVAGIAVYANSVRGGFIWDDEVFVHYNRYITSWVNLPKIFTEDMGAGGGGYYGFFRPLQMVTYMVDYTLWGLDPRAYHLLNILLHCLTGIALYFFSKMLFRRRSIAFFAGILFTIHPIQTEAVSYISGRGDPLVVFFMLLAFIFYLRQLRGSFLNYILMMLCCALALLSKESSLILPVLLLTYHYLFKEKVRLRGLLSIAVLDMVYVAVRRFCCASVMPSISVEAMWGRVPGFFVALSSYARLLVAPLGLHMEYVGKRFGFADWRVLAGIGIAATLVIVFFRKRNDRLISFSIAWFCCSLAPVSNIYPPLAFFMAEHYLYLPSIGFFLAGAGGIDLLCREKKYRIFGVGILAFMCGACCLLTIRQNGYWRDQVTFYTRTLKYAPESTRMYNNLGNIYLQKGKTAEAVAILKKGALIDPPDAFLYNTLGQAYMNNNEPAEAARAFMRAVEINPQLGPAYSNLAFLYYRQQNYGQALAWCDNARTAGCQLNPELLELLKPYRR